MHLLALSIEHAPATAAWMDDPLIARGIGLRRKPSLDSTRDWIRRAHADPTIHPFAIVIGADHVGNVILDKLDRYLSTARLSIYVGRAEARGVGVAQQAIVLASTHAGEALDLHKLWLTVHTANAAAIAAYTRCGFVEEGILRDEFLIDGARTDILRMGLILGGSAA